MCLFSYKQQRPGMFLLEEAAFTSHRCSPAIWFHCQSDLTRLGVLSLKVHHIGTCQGRPAALLTAQGCFEQPVHPKKSWGVLGSSRRWDSSRGLEKLGTYPRWTEGVHEQGKTKAGWRPTHSQQNWLDEEKMQEILTGRASRLRLEVLPRPHGPWAEAGSLVGSEHKPADPWPNALTGTNLGCMLKHKNNTTNWADTPAAMYCWETEFQTKEKQQQCVMEGNWIQSCYNILSL